MTNNEKNFGGASEAALKQMQEEQEYRINELAKLNEKLQNIRLSLERTPIEHIAPVVDKIIEARWEHDELNARIEQFKNDPTIRPLLTDNEQITLRAKALAEEMIPELAAIPKDDIEFKIKSQEESVNRNRKFFEEESEQYKQEAKPKLIYLIVRLNMLQAVQKGIKENTIPTKEEATAIAEKILIEEGIKI